MLEKIILENVLEQMQKPNNLDYIISGIMREQERRAQVNVVLSLLLKEQRQTENAIQNIMTAIENGGTTNTVMKRMRELEARLSELEQQILIEKSKTTVQLSESQIREFYTKALALEPKLLINYLIKQITLYEDRIEIEYNSPIKQSPDNDNRGFLICSKTVKLSFKAERRAFLTNYEFDIEIYV